MLRALFAGLCLIVAGVPAAAAQEAASSQELGLKPAAAPNANDAELFFDGLMGQMLDTESIAGTTVSVVEDGQVLLSKGYGFSDVTAQRRANGRDTRFRIGSVTKLFVWTAVMQQVERGKLDLDADINRYLDFTIPATFAKPITMRHLMSHTAGFEDKMLGMAAYGKNVRPDRTLGAALKDTLPKRIAAPGQQIAYSNYGAALAAYIVERIAHESFDSYARRNIFLPLGMTHTTFKQQIEAPLPNDLSQSYRFSDGGLLLHPVEHIYVYPAGAVTSTADDMAKFMVAMLGDGQLGTNRILSAQTARQMQGHLASNAPGIEGMAHGFYEVNIDGRRLLAHGGKIAGFTSLLIISPETGTGIFVSMNTLGRVMTVEQTARAYMRRFHPGTTPRAAPIAAGNASVAAYVGAYRPNIMNYSGLEHIGAAMSAAKVTKSANGGIVLTLGRDIIRWVPAGPDMFVRADGAELRDRLVFSRNRDGQVTSFTFGSRPFVAFNRLHWSDTPAALWTLLGASVVAATAILVMTVMAFIRRKRRSDSRLVVAVRAMAAGFAVAVLATMALTAVGVMSLSGLPPTTPAAFVAAKFIALAGVGLAVASAITLAIARIRDQASTKLAVQFAVVLLAAVPFCLGLQMLNWSQW